MLKDWFDILKPGGELILETPNLLVACQQILENPLGNTIPYNSPLGCWILYGDPSTKNDLMTHRWSYTPQSLTTELFKAGFRNIEIQAAQYKMPGRDFRIVGYKPNEPESE